MSTAESAECTEKIHEVHLPYLRDLCVLCGENSYFLKGKTHGKVRAN
jgi:hypothetical protein